MPVNSSDYGRYGNPGGRPVNEMGHTTPSPEYSDSQRPAVPFVPAPYLPAGRFDEHKRANVVLSAGTPVALDTAGSLVPAGIPVGHVFDYTTLDVRTGLPAVRRPDTGAALTSATVGASYAMDTDLADSRTKDGFFLQPVGVVSYNVYQFEGHVTFTSWPDYTLNYDNPAHFPIHNTMAQPETLSAITCDYVLEVPYIWNRNLLSDTVKIFDNTAGGVEVLSDEAKSYPFAHDELVGTIGSGSDTQDEYLGSGVQLVFVSPACGAGISGFTGSGLLAGTAGAATYQAHGSQTAGTAVDIRSEGYHILYDGEDTGKYVVLRTANTEWAASGYQACQIDYGKADTIQPGDYVACRLGKFVRFDPARMEEGDKIGQVLRRRTSAIKRSYLDRVKTAYDRSATVSHKMPGSATRGVSYLMSLVTDAAQVQLEKQETLDGTDLASAGLPAKTALPLGSIVINLLR